MKTTQSSLEKAPLEWKLKCPVCGCSCDVKYVMGLAPLTFSNKTIENFFCPSHRFVRMELIHIETYTYSDVFHQLLHLTYQSVSRILSRRQT